MSENSSIELMFMLSETDVKLGRVHIAMIVVPEQCRVCERAMSAIKLDLISEN